MKKSFVLKVTMDEKDVNEFITFLKVLERLGHKKEDELVGYFANGSKGFAPKFELNIPYEVKACHNTYSSSYLCERYYGVDLNDMTRGEINDKFDNP